MSWTSYHSYKTLVAYMDCLASKYPKRTLVHTIGKSFEGRDLKVMKIGSRGSGGRKKAVWIDGGIHAREWISPATVSFLLKEFVENSSRYRRLLKKYDVYIMPSMNPDGYEYSRNVNRMWRKTRSKNKNSRCVGTDPNRNWGYKWGGQGSSRNPCNETYRGSKPFSEPETAAVKQFILARKRQISMFFTFHSYGWMILYPWGYAKVENRNENELKRVGNIGSKAMGGSYQVGHTAKMLYSASGGSIDWAQGVAGIPYAFAIELPP